MDEALQGALATMGDEVRATALSDAGKETALGCLGRLPRLYAQFRLTSESRYGEEIARLVRTVQKELTAGKRGCPEAKRLAAGLPERLRLLHEEHGLPALGLKPLRS